MGEWTISAYTLSKTYAMTGWRVGYAAAPGFLVVEMEKLQEHLVSGVTAVAQRAALGALPDDLDEHDQKQRGQIAQADVEMPQPLRAARDHAHQEGVGRRQAPETRSTLRGATKTTTKRWRTR